MHTYTNVYQVKNPKYSSSLCWQLI